MGVVEEQGGREPASHPSSCALGRWPWEDCQILFTQPWVGIWLCEATDPTWQGVDKGQPLVPGSQSLASHAGYGRGAENKIGAPGQHQAPEIWEEGRGREVPMQARVLSPGLDEQRQSMILELYCRNAGGKREIRKRGAKWREGRKRGKEEGREGVRKEIISEMEERETDRKGVRGDLLTGV